MASASLGVNLLAVTVGARLSCISSFFKFLIRMDVVKANPCDPVERPKPRPGAPSGLSAPQMQQLLQVIPDTLKGRRDLAIVLTLVLTGRRRSEVVNLTAGDVSYRRLCRVLSLPRQGRSCAAAVNSPAPPLSSRYGDLLADVGKDLSLHASFRVAMAGRRWSPGRLQRHLLQPLPHLPQRRPASLLRASTSYATPLPSSAATSASRSSP